ncbi:response regulator [Spirosoma validum]|uniref:Response regulator n=1 Tax=Spirosoma validum TaxID=2771355 RepID=A0A927B2R7_9BACT|nr:response regulator [Spirosoma validum]MBD2754335.1 response regulator [Spirosoma validum]
MLLINNHETIRANFKRAKVLIIEDSNDHWMLIKNVMQQCLPEVVPVRVDTPDKALILLHSWTTQEWEIPKLILQDLYLPDRADGWYLLDQIKAMPSPCNRIPVVVLSSSNARKDIEEAYRRGSSSYLVKPTNYEGWHAFFQELRAYWWETVTLPPIQFSL